ncbi:unnamed protein product, partial [marine sediment metagenome]
LQVPTLWDEDLVLWESGLIAEYLLKKYRKRTGIMPPLALDFARPDSNWEDRRIFVTVQTLGTAATTISQMKWSGVAHNENEYLTRSADRIPYLMKWLESQLPSEQQGFFNDALSVQDIFLSCHLGFIANRPIGLDPQLEKYPKIAAVVARTHERGSFSSNPILWWDPGVVGYAEDDKTPIYET